MPSSFVHAIVPTACVILSASALPRLDKKSWIRLCLASAFLANSPDLDLIPASFFGEQWVQVHRQWGHNVFSLCGLSIFGYYLVRRWACPALGARLSWTLAISLVLSHIFLDSMGSISGHPTSVPILWPISSWSLSLPIPLFSGLTRHEIVGNPVVAHVMSERYWHEIIFRELAASLCLLTVWASTVTTARWMTRKSRKREKAKHATPNYVAAEASTHASEHSRMSTNRENEVETA